MEFRYFSDAQRLKCSNAAAEPPTSVVKDLLYFVRLAFRDGFATAPGMSFRSSAFPSLGFLG